MPVLIAALVSLAVFILSQRYWKHEGVRLYDEWQETRGKIVQSSERKNLIIGVVTVFIIAYVITGRLFFAAIATPGGYYVGKWLTKRSENKRMALLEEQYTQVLNVMITSLQGPSSNVYKVLEETVASLKNPAKDVFIEILRRSRTGTKHYEAIGAVANDVGWEDLKQLEMAFRLYDKTGSNLEQVCSHLLKNAYDRKGNRKYVEATTSQIRSSAVTLSVIPFFLMGFMRFMAPDFIAPMYDTTGGVIVLIIIVVMVLMGNKIVGKMVEGLK